MYNLIDIYNVLMKNNVEPTKGGTRRDFWRVFFTLPAILNSIKKYGYITGSVFWDLLGFAEYVFAKKTKRG